MTPDRWECPDCGASGWGAVSSTLFRPQFDHDRPDGRRCRAAARRGRSVPAPRRVYSLTQEQARWLQEAWETEGGCYVPLGCGDEPHELVESGLATYREVSKTSDTPVAPGSAQTCAWTEYYLVPTPAGLELLEASRRR